MKTIILDLDGTMVDCKQLHQDGFRWAISTLAPEAKYTNEELEGLPTTTKIETNFSARQQAYHHITRVNVFSALLLGLALV